MEKKKKLSEEMARELCGERDLIAKYISHIFFVQCPVSPRECFMHLHVSNALTYLKRFTPLP
jgi:hypothetical protein